MGKNVSFCISFQTNQASTKQFFFQNVVIRDAFQHVWLENAFYKCNFHQNFTANSWLCLLFGEMNKLSERNALEIFFSCKVLQDSYKNCNFCKKHNSSNFLQDLKKSCKFFANFFANCSFCKKFAKVVLMKIFARFFAKKVFLVN